MPILTRAFASLLLFAAFVTLPSPASAQELRRGTWTGSITQPDGMSFDVGYEVSGDPGEPAIELLPPSDSGAEDQRFPFKDIELIDDRLTFVWDMGFELSCSLEPRPGGAWAGTCTDGGGQQGGIVMIPPMDN